MTDGARLQDKPGAWVDLALTLPIFVLYQLGVVFLRVQNATDLVTGPLLRFAAGDRLLYLGLTVGIGVVFAAVFAILGRGHAFRMSKFVQIAIEGVVYATAMRFGASYLVGRIFAGPMKPEISPFVGFVMSLGAGFYEELAFRAILFGLGAKAIVWMFAHERLGLVQGQSRLTFRSVVYIFVWALVCAAIFSGIHYVGAFADPFDLTSFTFRFLLGLALTLIYVTRGFAAAVWTHAAYDIWVMVLPH